MQKKIQYLSAFVLLIIIVASFTLIPLIASTLTSSSNYLPYIVADETPMPTPTPRPTPIPFPTPKPSPGPWTSMVIMHIQYLGSSDADEYVEIKNIDSHSVQMQGWTLWDDYNHIFTFPSFVMEPDRVCRVYTNEIHSEWCGFSYGSDSSIWNSNNCALLVDSDNRVHDSQCAGA